jgi:hypothetical protein
MIATEATPSRDPGNAALHHPSSGKGTEPGWKKRVPVHLGAFGHQHSAPGHGEGANRLHDPAQVDFEPGDHLASVVAISAIRSFILGNFSFKGKSNILPPS